MKYTESSNQLILGNTVPISDEEGKQIEDSEKIFDFKLNMNITGDFQVAYEVAVEKDSTSTLEDKYVKLYLERSLDGANYEEVMEPAVYTPIKEKSQFGAPAGSMIVDTGIVNKSTKYYYRLRMWVDGSYEKEAAEETYEVKINSYGTTEKNTMDENKPVCTFGEYKELNTTKNSTIELICTDNTVGIEKKELVIADFVNSNKELGEILEVSKAEKIANGYKYTLTLKGLSTGKFKIELPKDIIVDKLGNSNEAVSKEIEVKGLTYQVTYEIGNNVDSIGKTQDSCTTIGKETSCEVTLPSITAIEGYTVTGWNSSKTLEEDIEANTTYTVTEDKTMYANAEDKTGPVIEIAIPGDSSYTKEKNIKVTISDKINGVASTTSVKYGWSTSNTTLPSTYATISPSYDANTKTATFTANGSGLTGKYYLWIVPITVEDELGNKTITNKISTETFYFDNTVPSITLGTNSSTTYSKIYAVNINLADTESGLVSGQSLKYGWSTSNTTAPGSYTTISTTIGAAESTPSAATPIDGQKSYTMTVNGSGLTGSYYLWVVGVTVKDVAGNSNTSTIVSTGTFKFDNTAPICDLKVVNVPSLNSVTVQGNCIDNDSAISKYEFSVDNNAYVTSSNSNYTFSSIKLSTMKIRVSDNLNNTSVTTMSSDNLQSGYQLILNKINESIISNQLSIDKIYPIGSIYISINSIEPASLFGGTWEKYGVGRILMGVATSGTSETVGGNSNVSLSAANIPSHSHSIPALSGTTAIAGAHTHTATGTVASTFTGSSVTTSSDSHSHTVTAKGTIKSTFSNGKAASAGAHKHKTAAGTESLAQSIDGSDYGGFKQFSNLSTESAGAHTHTVTGTVASTFTGTSVTTSSDSHSHTLTAKGTVASTFSSGAAASAGAHTHTISTTASTTGTTGSGTSFSVQNPYVTVYMWKRTK